MKTKWFFIPALLCGLTLLTAASWVAPKGGGDGYSVGDVVEDFSLKNIDGKMVSLASYKKAKGFIVTFTCNHCPYAKLYEDRLIELHNKYASKGYPVVAINPNDVTKQPEDSFENMKKRAKEKGFPFAYLYDETQEIATAYGATRTPHVYILHKDGKELKVKYIGAIDDNPRNADDASEFFVSDAINALLKGKEVKKTHTKAIGCTIKWKE
ncbi:MAG: thioredoxin family protein [Flammeovirgaceae bacterium]